MRRIFFVVSVVIIAAIMTINTSYILGIFKSIKKDFLFTTPINQSKEKKHVKHIQINFTPNLEISYGNNSVYVVEFYSSYCPHCAEAKPYIEMLKKKYNFTLIKINIDNRYNALFAQYVLNKLNSYLVGTPTFIICNKVFVGFIDPKKPEAKRYGGMYVREINAYVGTLSPIEEEIKKKLNERCECIEDIKKYLEK